MSTQTPLNKAAVAYLAGSLIARVSDNDKFDSDFINTDLGGSSCSLEPGLEAVVTDVDMMMGMVDRKDEDAWMKAHDYLCEKIEGDALLERSVDAFNAKDQDRQWEGSGPRPIQRRLIAVARRLLVDLYADAQLPAKVTPAEFGA